MGIRFAILAAALLSLSACSLQKDADKMIDQSIVPFPLSRWQHNSPAERFQEFFVVFDVT